MIELLTQKLTDLEHPMLMSNPVCLSHRERVLRSLPLPLDPIAIYTRI